MLPPRLRERTVRPNTWPRVFTTRASGMFSVVVMIMSASLRSALFELDVLRLDRAGRPARGLVVAPVEIRVGDDEFRRRRAPGREILGGVRVADERCVVAAHERAVQRRA